MGDLQQFSTAPQAVGTRKAKYRDPNDPDGGNMMHDNRIVRGNTYASTIQPQPDAAEVQKQREAQRRRLMRANQTKRRAGTPEPVQGRKHMDIQTDSYLEELTERTVEFEAETQTDFLLDRPPSPLFMPAKIGIDTETQIEDGELFDFDVEVEPVLEVLVGKTLEQSMMEVLEEEELESLRRHQEDFEKRRNAELLEVQRMEAAEKRRSDEMERRMQQQAAQREQDLSIMRKVVSRSVASAHLSSLRDRALAHLLDAGVFADGVQLAVESQFMPELLSIVMRQMEQHHRDNAAIGASLDRAVRGGLEQQTQAIDKEKARIQRRDDDERQFRDDREKEIERRDLERQRIVAEQEAMTKWEKIVSHPWGDKTLRLLGRFDEGPSRRWIAPTEEASSLFASTADPAQEIPGISLQFTCVKKRGQPDTYMLRAGVFEKGPLATPPSDGAFWLGLKQEGNEQLLDAACAAENAACVQFVPAGGNDRRVFCVALRSVDGLEAKGFIGLSSQESVEGTGDMWLGLVADAQSAKPIQVVFLDGAGEIEGGAELVLGDEQPASADDVPAPAEVEAS